MPSARLGNIPSHFIARSDLTLASKNLTMAQLAVKLDGRELGAVFSEKGGDIPEGCMHSCS